MIKMIFYRLPKFLTITNAPCSQSKDIIHIERQLKLMVNSIRSYNLFILLKKLHSSKQHLYDMISKYSISFICLEVHIFFLSIFVCLEVHIYFLEFIFWLCVFGIIYTTYSISKQLMNIKIPNFFHAKITFLRLIQWIVIVH